MVVGGLRADWRNFGIVDAVVFVKGVGLGSVSSVLIILFAYHFDGYSRSVFVIDGVLLMLFLVGSRASFRLARPGKIPGARWSSSRITSCVAWLDRYHAGSDSLARSDGSSRSR